MEDLKDKGFRSGFVALCGRPNVGKSTLLNRLIGEPIALATRFPQTTRERMLGIWNGEQFQAVLVDTPGIHRPRSALNRFMVDQALRGASDVDLILYLVECPQLKDAEQAEQWEPGPGASDALQRIQELGRPILLVMTKCDLAKNRDLILPIIAKWQSIASFEAVVPVSAVQQKGLDELQTELVSRLPSGPALYDNEQLSDRTMRWHCAEIVRGELFHALGDELPYSCAVEVTGFQEKNDCDRISATVFVERESQKGIVIGSGARMIKRISMKSREKIQEFSGRDCQLFLDVRVATNWTKDPQKLSSLGYREE